MVDKRYATNAKYETCPICGKKLFKITDESYYYKVFVWCKQCKKEIEVNQKEPKSHKH